MSVSEQTIRKNQPLRLIRNVTYTTYQLYAIAGNGKLPDCLPFSCIPFLTMTFIVVFKVLACSLVEAMAYFPDPFSNTDGHLVVKVQTISFHFASIPFGKVNLSQFYKMFTKNSQL